jgi:hypothetical protein
MLSARVVPSEDVGAFAPVTARRKTPALLFFLDCRVLVTTMNDISTERAYWGGSPIQY